MTRLHAALTVGSTREEREMHNTVVMIVQVETVLGVAPR